MKESWKGIGELIEETGELNQILGKLIAFPDGVHAVQGDLKNSLEEELADTWAALLYFIKENRLDFVKIVERRNDKEIKFEQWGLSGLYLP